MQSVYINNSHKDKVLQMIFKGLLSVAIVAAVVYQPVYAQSLKQTGVNIFNALYGIVGVCGAIATLIAGVNWAMGNFLGAHDPKKIFFQVLLGTAIALGSVAIIQFLKDSVGGSGGGIGSL